MCKKLRVSIGFFILVSHFNPSSSNAMSIYNFPEDESFYPFIAAVKSKAGVCTATIINEYYILTAAHCFYFRNKPIGDKDANILAGVVNYDLPRAATKQVTMSQQIIIHPDFMENRVSKFDVALVRVRDKFEFSNNVRPIKIAAEEWPQDNNQSMNCMVLGFGGYRSTAPATTRLKVWNVTAKHSQSSNVCSCARRYEKKRTVFAYDTGYPKICRSDDGGPLVCGNEVRAIAHMVWNCMTCEDLTYPLFKCNGGPEKGSSVFFYLCVVNDWLHNIVPDIEPRPVSCEATFLSTSSTGLFICLFLLFLRHYY